MKTFNQRKCDILLFCGDIHGNLDIIPKFIKKNELKNCVIVQVGDFGIGFETEYKENRRLDYLNNQLLLSNSFLYVIRGNHDNPKYFTGEYNKSNIFLLEDYSVININGINMLGIGGAISIDRIKRKGFYKDSNSHSYWKDENVVFDYGKLKEIKNIDIVFTHTCPNFVPPYTKNGINDMMSKDVNLEKDVNNERQILTNIYNVLSINNNIKNWYYGHFHFDENNYINNTKFTVINKNTLIEHRL